MSERFAVGDRVIAEDTEKAGVVRELDPGVDAYWYAVEFDDVTLNYPHALLRAIHPSDELEPADPPARGDKALSDAEKLARIREGARLRILGEGGWSALSMSVHVKYLLDALDTVTKERDAAVKQLNGILFGTGVYNDWHQLSRYLDSVSVVDFESYKAYAVGAAASFFRELGKMADDARIAQESADDHE